MTREQFKEILAKLYNEQFYAFENGIDFSVTAYDSGFYCITYKLNGEYYSTYLRIDEDYKDAEFKIKVIRTNMEIITKG